MADTVIEPDEKLRARFAPPFTATGKSWTHWDFRALAGAGGIRSTMADMMRFASAMLRPAETPLQKAIELAFTRQDLAATFAPGGQALGWFLAGDGDTRWHNGQTGGFHAAIFANPKLGVATVLLSNRSTPVGTEIAGSLFRRAAGKPERPMPNRDRAEVELTSEQLDRCTGTFQISPKLAVVCEHRDLALFVTPTDQPADRLHAASANTFFSRRAPVEIVFEFPNDGKPATSLVLKQGGRDVRGVK